ncbi:MAG TPA: hypothetical protein VM889_13740 [Candidatus Thermoplasmatota archaeon]|nr:hypothetical protein [Candidatus Thermoplasmatota archaeon]
MDPVRVVLGSCEVVGDKATGRAPARLDVSASRGQPVDLVLVCGIAERSRQNEAWGFRLEATFAGGPSVVATRETRDLPLASQNEHGELVERVVFDRAGRHEGQIVMRATYARGPWLGSGPEPVSAWEHRGKLVVNVS